MVAVCAPARGTYTFSARELFTKPGAESRLGDMAHALQIISVGIAWTAAAAVLSITLPAIAGVGGGGKLCGIAFDAPMDAASMAAGYVTWLAILGGVWVASAAVEVWRCVSRRTGRRRRTLRWGWRVLPEDDVPIHDAESVALVDGGRDPAPDPRPGTAARVE